jgi:3-oxoacyl-[acyl-carrier-protein] synthase II
MPPPAAAAAHPTLAEFQQTMREFVAVQARVMTAYLSGAQGPQPDAVFTEPLARRPEPQVLITGIGMVTPLGIGWPETWDGLCAGRSGIGPPRRWDCTGVATQFAGEVPEGFEAVYKARCRMPFPERYARFTQLGMLSGVLAVEDAGIDLAGLDRLRLGVSVGVGAGSFNYLLDVDERLRSRGNSLWPALDHNYVVKSMANAPSAQLSIWAGARGPSTTISLACATGAQAIAAGCDWIRAGRADVVLAGACDSTVNPFVIHAYNQINALSKRNDEPQRASRPFDRGRDGFVMAEAGAVLVLESAEHAARRGARAYARIAGHASVSEAYNVVTPRPHGEGMAQTMRLALQDAGVAPEAIGYVAAHGTSTRLNDLNETAAIKTVFGAAAHRLPVSAMKSMLGHAIGASSAVQTGIVALSLYHRIATPTINYDEPDAECDLDYVPNVARDLGATAAMSNAFAFGGHNCSVVLVR